MSNGGVRSSSAVYGGGERHRERRRLRKEAGHFSRFEEKNGEKIGSSEREWRGVFMRKPIIEEKACMLCLVLCMWGGV